jgi:hypothetical protein
MIQMLPILCAVCLLVFLADHTREREVCCRYG